MKGRNNEVFFTVFFISLAVFRFWTASIRADGEGTGSAAGNRRGELRAGGFFRA